MNDYADTVEIEVSLAQAKKMVERKAMVHKLLGNREFKTLILEGYYKDEATRLVGLLGDPAMQPHRDDIIRSMEGISQLQGYFRTVVQMGSVAEREVADYQNELEEIAAADAAGE